MKKSNFSIPEWVKEEFANNFANNDKQWQRYLQTIALKFLESYFENFDFVGQHLDPLAEKERKNLPLTKREERKFDKLALIIDLRWMIKFGKGLYDPLKIDIKKIEKSFVLSQDDSQDQVDEVSREMNEASLKVGASFGELEFLANYLISYVKDKEVRKGFYFNYILNVVKAKEVLTDVDFINCLHLQSQSPINNNWVWY